MRNFDCWRLFYDADSNQFWLRMRLYARYSSEKQNSLTIDQ
jgi:hypothetical protein